MNKKPTLMWYYYSSNKSKLTNYNKEPDQSYKNLSPSAPNQRDKKKINKYQRQYKISTVPPNLIISLRRHTLENSSIKIMAGLQNNVFLIVFHKRGRIGPSSSLQNCLKMNVTSSFASSSRASRVRGKDGHVIPADVNRSLVHLRMVSRDAG